MKKTNKNREINYKKNKVLAYKNSFLKSFFTPFSKLNLALAILFLLAFIASAGDVIVDNGNLYIEGPANNVGIGTTNPAQKLEINGGNIVIDRLGANSDSLYIGTGGTDGTINVGVSGGAQIEFQNVLAGGNSDQLIHFITHDTGTSHGRRMTIDQSGNVGIGTTGPGYKLQVVGTADADGFYFKGYTTTTGEKDVFTIEDPDLGGGGQDESSVLKVIKSNAWSSGDDGSSLLELTYNVAVPGVADRHFYTLGRAGASSDEGTVAWGISQTDADIWTTGSIRAGATGTNCGATGAACFNSPSIALETSGNSHINTGGNVGIGTTIANSRLHVKGDLRIETAAGNYCILRISDTTSCAAGTLLGTNANRALCLICN